MFRLEWYGVLTVVAMQTTRRAFLIIGGIVTEMQEALDDFCIDMIA